MQSRAQRTYELNITEGEGKAATNKHIWAVIPRLQLKKIKKSANNE